MNAFKAGLINSQCCNHFPFTRLTQCHWLSQLALYPYSSAASRAAPPHTSARLLEPAVYRQHTPHGTRRFAAHVARQLTPSPAHGDVSKTISNEIRQPRRTQAHRSIVLEYWRWVTVRFGHLAVSSLAPRSIALV